MEIEFNVSKSLVEAIFKTVSSKRYTKAVDFDSITKELSKLKEGGRLTYEHLEMISDEKVWPFSNWWRWPTKDQIYESLLKTEGLFRDLNGLSEIHEERLEIEKNIIHVLYYDIFKHLELVSIVLRFIDEYNYAIYSPPVTRILNPPRGYSYTIEYLNYLKEIRKYKFIYQLEKAAYVDMFLWAIEVRGDESEEILDLFHKHIEDSVRKDVVRNILNKNVMNKSDLEKSIFYCDIGEYDLAAKLAGCAYENALQKKCIEKRIPLVDENNKPKTLGAIVNDYYGYSRNRRNELKRKIGRAHV
jgi:hypothetical protein